MTCPDLVIRAATVQDLDDLVRLEKICFNIPWSRESLANELTANLRARVLVAEQSSGLLVGYLSGWVVLDELQINNIAVDPESRRKGIGRCLLRQMIAMAESENLSSIFLEVRERNRAARSLYASLGFLPVGGRRAYYADTGEDAVILLKKIGDN
ncbi:MAG: ribosomal protein S18-alanine N-acetyltransferase [Saccharofermentanales bacterium]|jgi:ribosomal-protein-alanine N-acetyltransferase|nr:ribosomal protein S18-alanine N-acetyltransferase [Clostridiaceae bacterium]